MTRVFITGIGVITALGNSVAENQQALKEGVCGIGLSTNLESKYSHTFPVGEIKITTEALKSKLELTDPSVTRTTALAIHAFNEALDDSGLTDKQLSSGRTALIGGTTVGGMCLTDELYRDANSSVSNSPFLASYDCASVFLYLQQHYKMNGIINTINTACSSSANAIMFGARLIRLGLADRAIVGGADCLSKFTINGFHSLQILSPEICRPFDAARQGLNLGEGAAFLVLEKEADTNNKQVYAEVKGYANSSDAFHPSSLSPNGEGPYLAMKNALASAELEAGDIDLINAHGTATENNDEVESIAMKRVFERPPVFTSTKSNTGHTLGAAGAIEAVFSIINLLQQEVYPGLHFIEPIKETCLYPAIVNAPLRINHVMSNSFGFGGNCTSLILSKV
ncbi:MAG: beta-ketoacyl-[acyl-carrier-protein] synthase family protein [Ferruginibacter sp.]